MTFFLIQNIELNDLRKNICLGKTFSVGGISVYKVIENLVSMSAMLHEIFNHFILSAMLLHQCHGSVTIATREL